MAYESAWLVEGKVITHQYFNELDLDELHQSFDVLIDMIDSVDTPLVHIAVDIERLEKYPLQIARYGPVIKRLYTHPRLGWVIAYGQRDQILGFVGTAVTSMFKVRYRLFKTQEEAYTFLNDRDVTLPDLNGLVVEDLA